jgi:hypothetical protein
LFDWLHDREVLTTPPNPPDNFSLRVIETKEKRRAQGFFDVRGSLQQEPAQQKNKGNCSLM